MAAYDQTVLRALEQTENVLVAYREQQERLVKVADQARESARAASIARVRYREGVADFLALLDAERTQLQAEAGVFTTVVAVYEALGGIPNQLPLRVALTLSLPSTMSRRCSAPVSSVAAEALDAASPLY